MLRVIAYHTTRFYVGYGGRETPSIYDDFEVAWQRLSGHRNDYPVIWVSDPNKDKRRIAELEQEVERLQGLIK